MWSATSSHAFPSPVHAHHIVNEHRPDPRSRARISSAEMSNIYRAYRGRLDMTYWKIDDNDRVCKDAMEVLDQIIVHRDCDPASIISYVALLREVYSHACANLKVKQMTNQERTSAMKEQWKQVERHFFKIKPAMENCWPRGNEPDLIAIYLSVALLYSQYKDVCEEEVIWVCYEAAQRARQLCGGRISIDMRQYCDDIEQIFFLRRQRIRGGKSEFISERELAGRTDSGNQENVLRICGERRALDGQTLLAEYGKQVYKPAKKRTYIRANGEEDRTEFTGQRPARSPSGTGFIVNLNQTKPPGSSPIGQVTTFGSDPNEDVQRSGVLTIHVAESSGSTSVKRKVFKTESAKDGGSPRRQYLHETDLEPGVTGIQRNNKVIIEGYTEMWLSSEEECESMQQRYGARRTSEKERTKEPKDDVARASTAGADGDWREARAQAPRSPQEDKTPVPPARALARTKEAIEEEQRIFASELDSLRKTDKTDKKEAKEVWLEQETTKTYEYNTDTASVFDAYPETCYSFEFLGPVEIERLDEEERKKLDEEDPKIDWDTSAEDPSQNEEHVESSRDEDVSFQWIPDTDIPLKLARSTEIEECVFGRDPPSDRCMTSEQEITVEQSASHSMKKTAESSIEPAQPKSSFGYTSSSIEFSTSSSKKFLESAPPKLDEKTEPVLLSELQLPEPLIESDEEVLTASHVKAETLADAEEPTASQVYAQKETEDVSVSAFQYESHVASLITEETITKSQHSGSWTILEREAEAFAAPTITSPRRSLRISWPKEPQENTGLQEHKEEWKSRKLVASAVDKESAPSFRLDASDFEKLLRAAIPRLKHVEEVKGDKGSVRTAVADKSRSRSEEEKSIEATSNQDICSTLAKQTELSDHQKQADVPVSQVPVLPETPDYADEVEVGPSASASALEVRKQRLVRLAAVERTVSDSTAETRLTVFRPTSSDEHDREVPPTAEAAPSAVEFSGETSEIAASANSSLLVDVEPGTEDDESIREMAHFDPKLEFEKRLGAKNREKRTSFIPVFSKGAFDIGAGPKRPQASETTPPSVKLPVIVKDLGSTYRRHPLLNFDERSKTKPTNPADKPDFNFLLRD